MTGSLAIEPQLKSSVGEIIASIAFGSEYDTMIGGNEILIKLNEYNLLLRILTNISA